MTILYYVLAFLLGAVISGLISFQLASRKRSELDETLRREAQQEADALRKAAHGEAATIRAEAERIRNDAARIRQEAEIQAKAYALEQKARLEEEINRDRTALRSEREELRRERDEFKRELERLNRRAEQLDARGLKLDQLEEKVEADERRVQERLQQAEEKLRAAELRLFEVAGLSAETAREMILGRLEEELEEERAVRVKAMIEKANLEAKRRSQHIVAQAIQRSASETSAAMSVSVVPIPSEAMKGRIIGREGRNIRAFEALTGVDLIIDDTPEAVILSSFNPLRREVAKHALEQLVTDGRIHPTRIEEVVHKAQEDMKAFIHTTGEEGALEAGVVGLKPGMLQLLGRMYFRTSYGQNVLKHSIQVAHLTGLLAAELGLDPAMGRRAGLLHDVGKSIDREIEGTHVEIGISLAKRFGEPAEVIDAIAHHHDPENSETLYGVLVAAADAISAARPGARRESLEVYIKRLEQIEQIAVSFPGVETAYAIQAGREVRVIVQPEKVSDAKATLLAREIAGRIEQDMEYPGQVQVTVVRESRAVEYAK
ncbi:ribonuclease Y [Deinobacterium chartae]|uniref:Ribonuclease Y n=1 Tax=Deinobacterium chartae TaxID=521158 RepID=A0A841I2Q2_9DEIO|nr:ribonuclease Y [Deinobacterium chartae]MBB6099553.1 ribonuclease Y [Deinobacterium chartae]